MDFGLIEALRPAAESNPDAGDGPFEAFEAARWAMGDTRRFADRMDLIAMEPSRR